MKRTVSILCIVFLACISANLFAQKDKKKGGKTKEVAVNKPGTIFAVLGNSDVRGGEITKSEFDRLLKQGIVAKDSSGNKYNIQGFEFNYGARNLYEDETGNSIIATDYMIEYCFGDTVSRDVSDVIYMITKPGDTAYIDRISIMKPDSSVAFTKQMRFIITK